MPLVCLEPRTHNQGLFYSISSLSAIRCTHSRAFVHPHCENSAPGSLRPRMEFSILGFSTPFSHGFPHCQDEWRFLRSLAKWPEPGYHRNPSSERNPCGNRGGRRGTSAFRTGESSNGRKKPRSLIRAPRAARRPTAFEPLVTSSGLREWHQEFREPRYNSRKRRGVRLQCHPFCKLVPRSALRSVPGEKAGESR